MVFPGKHIRDNTLPFAKFTAGLFDDLDAKVSDAVLVGLREDGTSTSGAVSDDIVTIPIALNSVRLLRVWVAGKRSNGADEAVYRREASIVRGGAGAPVIKGPVRTPFTEESVAAEPWDATIAIVGNAAVIRVTGTAGHDIDWKSQYFAAVEI